MNGQNNPSLPTKSQMESHHNSTSSAKQNSCETAPWGPADQLCMQENALKSVQQKPFLGLSSQGQVHLCMLFQTAPGEGTLLKQLLCVVAQQFISLSLASLVILN